MRPSLVFIPFAACTTSPAAPDQPSFESVRDRLSAPSPTRLFAAAQTGVGSIHARRWTHDGWQDGETVVSVANGEVVARAVATGGVIVSKLAITVDPLAIPDVVFGQPAELTDVRFTLAQPAQATATWSGDDEATATLTVALDLDWSLAIDHAKSPLGTQHLPAMPVDLTLTGTGDRVDARLAVHATGELWSWAGLLELADLTLALDAATVD